MAEGVFEASSEFWKVPMVVAFSCCRCSLLAGMSMKSIDALRGTFSSETEVGDVLLIHCGAGRDTCTELKSARYKCIQSVHSCRRCSHKLSHSYGVAAWLSGDDRT